jgi:hypothetical protein
VVAGDHFFVNTQPQRLLAIVRAELAGLDAIAGAVQPTTAGTSGREGVHVPTS